METKIVCVSIYIFIHILIKNTCLLGKIDGRSLIKPGRYDRLYPDSEMYVREKNVKYGIKDKIMNYSAAVYYNREKSTVCLRCNILFNCGFLLRIFINE